MYKHHPSTKIYLTFIKNIEDQKVSQKHLKNSITKNH